MLRSRHLWRPDQQGLAEPGPNHHRRHRQADQRIVSRRN
ncbi:hypothetical protein CEV34_0647 [Brucella pseudogrignonensis]|uniref:Uncharacterized protein n=1 Tax=Brucella pseudogrignonensis TaxID=419475 RepID=A0A256GQH6_9HYPH|nr:hypothetical protein CEV34_0647 [Brucella pseudogrignonensis]